MKSSPLIITKASGELQPFSEKKLLESLMRSGASAEMAATIIEELGPRLYTGVSTKKIYRWAFGLLKNRSRHLAAKYHLKRAIMELGPSGFPFERFIAALLTEMGYDTQTGIIMSGRCVNHEVDVLAQKDQQYFMVECKYHNQAGTVSDVKVPLYIRARFQDVEQTLSNIDGYQQKSPQAWVVTNTKFTRDAVAYGNCVGLRLLSWDYPAKHSLKDLIDELRVYPVTCLVTLKKSEKKILLDKQVVLCKELLLRPILLNDLAMTESRRKSVIAELEQLCSVKAKRDTAIADKS